MNVVLISTYELGRQPFGIASPAAWLNEAGASITCFDLAFQKLDDTAIASADLVAFYLPMHTATRIAAPLIKRVRQCNPNAHICCYGLYAPVNEKYLRALGAGTILGGEFEEGLVSLYKRVESLRAPIGREAISAQPMRDCFVAPAVLTAGAPRNDNGQVEPLISLSRQKFLVPDRSGLPKLTKYAKLNWGDQQRKTGYTEASRGCKHLCRHCPIVPVYGGQFRIVQRAIVLADIRQQVALGARHITFGDPDFFNGPRHAIAIVEQLHDEFPDVTYDATIKIEHLLKHANLLPTLRDSGCALVTSAVESVDNRILEIFDKHHTRKDFIHVVSLCRAAGLTLNPTFVTFNPWISLEGYRDLLALLIELNLVEHVAPIQLAIRLLIPAGSRLLELPEVRQLVGAFDEAALCYPWAHPDPCVDQLHVDVLNAVKAGEANGESRPAIFAKVWRLACEACDMKVDWRVGSGVELLRQHGITSFALASKPIPHLSEPWYC
ncbi:MAG: CUAEP/CCAEP-tail radical SAM protein [Chloroflexota bacterium]